MKTRKEHYGPMDWSKGVWLNADKVESWKMHYSMTIDGDDFELTESQYETLKLQHSESVHEGRSLERIKILHKLENRRKRLHENSQGQTGEIWLHYQGLLAGFDQAIALIKGEQK